VRSFPVPHDAADPVGFRFESGGRACAILTDLGYATRLVCDAIRGIHALVLETNYDEILLQNDLKRPWSVKQRIASRHGHLSNSDAAALLARIEAPDLQDVVLAHLSRDCNSPGLAIAAAAASFEGRALLPRILCATQHEPSPEIALAAAFAAA
jgi:phosphoribosyl 1,2-cyclic phosphodiesterase